MGNKVKDLTGLRFGKLTVKKYCGIVNHRAMFECECDCGNTKIIQGTSLKLGHTRSCGCLAENNTDQTTHGLSKTHIYGVWNTMKSRCYNKNAQRYAFYGGRGITVCEEWRNDFMSFYNWALSNGYKDGMTLDREDNSGNYEPSNCRWIDQKAQMNNMRRNQLLTHNGKTQTMAQWAEEKNLCYGTLWSRLNRGWTIERALNTP